MGRRGRNLLRRIGLNERLFCRQATSHWADPSAIVEDACEPALVGEVEETWAKVDGLCNRMMFLDTLTYLPDDILVKVDLATMATGLEGRMPLLDHRVIEFAWSLPDEFKIDESWPKSAMKDRAQPFSPRALTSQGAMVLSRPTAVAASFCAERKQRCWQTRGPRFPAQRCRRAETHHLTDLARCCCTPPGLGGEPGPGLPQEVLWARDIWLLQWVPK